MGLVVHIYIVGSLLTNPAGRRPHLPVGDARLLRHGHGTRLCSARLLPPLLRAGTAALLWGQRCLPGHGLQRARELGRERCRSRDAERHELADARGQYYFKAVVRVP